MNKSQTVQGLIKDLQDLVNEFPHIKDFPVIYSDDDGNSYSKVYSRPMLTQVYNLRKRDLELAGFYVGNEDIGMKDCNCVIIN